MTATSPVPFWKRPVELPHKPAPIIDLWPQWKKSILVEMGFERIDNQKGSIYEFVHCSNILEVFEDGTFLVHSKDHINQDRKYSGKIESMIDRLIEKGIIYKWKLGQPPEEEKK
jgi:hypothetical protein